MEKVSLEERFNDLPHLISENLQDEAEHVEHIEQVEQVEQECTNGILLNNAIEILKRKCIFRHPRLKRLNY